MGANNKSNDQKRQSTLTEYLIEIHNAMQENNVNKVRKSIVKAIKVIMKEDMVFDQHIIDLLSLYMRYEQTKPQTVEKYLERRFSVFAKICKSKLVNLPYLEKMAKLTRKEDKCYLSTKIKYPKLKDEEILRKIDSNVLSYKVEKKKSDKKSSENLASADSALDSSMNKHSRSK